MPMGTRPKGTHERNWMDGWKDKQWDWKRNMGERRFPERSLGRKKEVVMVFQLGRASLADGGEEQVSSRSKSGFRE